MLCFDCFQLVSVLLLYRFLMSPLFYFLVMLFVCFCLWVAHLHCCKSDTTSHALCSITTHTHTPRTTFYIHIHISPQPHTYTHEERGGCLHSFLTLDDDGTEQGQNRQCLGFYIRFGYILRFHILDRFLWFWCFFMLLMFYDVLFSCDIVVIVENYYDLVW